MRKLDAHFADYEQDHRDPRNKAIHGVGIPTIALALLGLASRVSLVPLAPGRELDLAMALALVLALFYLSWHAGLALGFLISLVPLYLVGARIPVGWLWGLLAVGVGLQYLGHWIEGRQPAFHRNLVHTLVGPLWIVSRPFVALGLYGRRAGDPADR